MAQFPIRTPGWVEEFQKFIMRGNVVDLAVGIIIGVAFTAIVSSLVKDLFNPIIGLLLGGCSLRGGEGTVIGVVIGAAVMQVLRNSITLIDAIPDNVEFAVIGAVILAGAVVDEIVKRVVARRTV